MNELIAFPKEIYNITFKNNLHISTYQLIWDMKNNKQSFRFKTLNVDKSPVAHKKIYPQSLGYCTGY